MTNKYYIRLRKKLIHFEVILVPALKGSKDALSCCDPGK